jgi:hypothetical protein
VRAWGLRVALVVAATGGLTACGSSSNPAAPSNKNAAGVRARMYLASKYGKAKNYAAACALDTKADQEELSHELKVSNCVAAYVKLAEPLPLTPGFPAAAQAAAEAKARAEGYAELAERKIVVAGDKATVTDPKIGWTEEYVYGNGQWLLAKQNMHGKTYESSQKRYLAERKAYPSELRRAHELERREAAAQRAAASHKATEERANRAKEARERAAQVKEANEKQAKTQAADSAKKLVEIWKEEPVEASNENVLSIQRHLVSLGSKCEQSIPTLANEIYATVEILKKAGVSETPVSIAAAFDTAAPGKNVTPECKSILSALTVLIEKGEG